MPPAKRPVQPPRRRSLGTYASKFDLENRDPKMAYVWVPKNRDELGVGDYESRGYEIVPTSATGVRAKILPKAYGIGKPQEVQGNILMQIPQELKNARDAEGLAEMDEIDRQISSPNNIARIDRRVRDYNETEPAQLDSGR